MQQPPPPAEEEEIILVATADGTGVPVRSEDRSSSSKKSSEGGDEFLFLSGQLLAGGALLQRFGSVHQHSRTGPDSAAQPSAHQHVSQPVFSAMLLEERHQAAGPRPQPGTQQGLTRRAPNRVNATPRKCRGIRSHQVSAWATFSGRSKAILTRSVFAEIPSRDVSWTQQRSWAAASLTLENAGISPSS
jgi:hypothetical protein